MEAQVILYILGLLEGLAIVVLGFMLKKLISNGETLASMYVQVKEINGKVKDHETRIRTIENHG